MKAALERRITCLLLLVLAHQYFLGYSNGVLVFMLNC